MIDSHTHLNDPRLLSDVEAVVARMLEAGVSGALVVGYDVDSSRKAVELARRRLSERPDLAKASRDPDSPLARSGLRAAVGMHPHESKHLDADALGALEKLARAPKVVAYGEIGLDFHYDHSPRDVQRDAFRRQLEVAARLGLPIVIHEREAAEEVMAALDDENGWARGGVWHCCDLGADLAKEIARSFFIGMAGWITFPKAENIRAMARVIPLERLLVETDAPYLAPVPHRGKRNEPAYVRLVAEELAKVKGITVDRVAGATRQNTFSAFPRWGDADASQR